MASFFRWRIANKVIPVLKKAFVNEEFLSPSVISSFVKVSRSPGHSPQLLIPLEKLKNASYGKNDLMNPKELVTLLRNQGLPTAEGFIDITLDESSSSIMFTVDKHVFSKIILMDICSNDEILAKNSCFFQNVPPKRVVVECWMPKIGENFKMAHFRSAIHTNFIANINRAAGHDVIKIRHIKDFCFESAILLTGFQYFGSKDELLTKPCQHLSEVSKATMSEYKNSLDFRNEVNDCFEKMQEGEIYIASEWNYLSDLSSHQHYSIYEKIGLTLDDVHIDSLYSSQINEVEKDLLRKNLIVIQDDGRVKVNINSDVESDESTNYNEMNSFRFDLSSRIFYASYRKKKYDFDVMYHVAPTSEKNSFSLVNHLLKELGYTWSDNLKHIRLKDISHFKRHKKAGAEEIMDQAKVFMLNKLQTDLQMQAVEAVEQMAEMLSLSSLTIYDMKHRRNVDYDFNWNNILSLGQNSGVSLQMCHAGLKGLQDDADYKFNIEADTSPLSEPAAQHLIKHLARFDEMVYKSYITLEPCIILQYLFSLWHFTDKASNELKMCREFEKKELEVLKARLMLYEATLRILQRGLYLLGVKPFETNYSPPDFVKNETYKNIFNK